MKRNVAKTSCKRGFTLIELLVVVLIIGILAAVAVPQYQKAVMKSKSLRLLPLIKAIDSAEQVYYLANGEYATVWEALDVNFPAGAQTESDNMVYYGNYYCQINYRAGGTLFSTYCYDTDAKAPKFEKYTTDQAFLCWGNNGKQAQEICRSICGVEELDDFGGGYVGCYF